MYNSDSYIKRKVLCLKEDNFQHMYEYCTLYLVSIVSSATSSHAAETVQYTYAVSA